MKNSSAFTLIELLASMTLATLLALTVLTVLGGVSRAQSSDAAALPTEAWPESMTDRMRDDLMNARTLRVERDGFSLDGYARLGPGGGNADHFPVHVRYQLKSLAGRSCLIREQRTIGGHDSWRDLVAADVEQIQLTKLQPPAAKSLPTSAVELAKIPPRVRIQIRATDPARPLFDRILVVRDE